VKNEKGITIIFLRSGQGGEFQNEKKLCELFESFGITHNFSTPKTP